MTKIKTLERRLAKRHTAYGDLKGHVDSIMAKQGRGLVAEWSDLVEYETALDDDATMWTTARRSANRKYNRYSDILANEGTRFKLPGMSNDYINANFIHGAQFGVEYDYIVGQAPVPETLEHWWLMLWSSKVCKGIVVPRAHSWWAPNHFTLLHFLPCFTCGIHICRQNLRKRGNVALHVMGCAKI